MSRSFKKADYEQTLNLTIRLGDCLPPDHLARFVVETVAKLDLSALYARYGTRGGTAYAPEILLSLLLYGYATGVFSSRKIERATYESIPFRFIAGDLHPDHDTLAHFRQTFLPEIKELFVQVLLLAQQAGVLKLGTISLDGSKVHADASKHHAVSYKHLLKLESQLRLEVEELVARADQPEEVPEGLVIKEELKRRKTKLEQLAQAKEVLSARAEQRTATEQAEYEDKLQERAERERTTGRKPGGRPPKPPVPGPRDNDQYNFTDPESRIMKNPTNTGGCRRIIMHRSLWIRRVCSLWDTPSLIIPMIVTKPNQLFKPFRRPLSARQRPQPWTRGILGQQPSLPVPSARSKLTSPPAVILIIRAGYNVSLNCQIRHQRMPALRSRWPTNSRRLWAK